MTNAGNREGLHEKDLIQQALRDSQARLVGIISSAMDAIITVDESQQIILLNRAAEEMFGYRGEDLIGQSLNVLLPERFRNIHRQHIARFGETGVTNRTMGRLGTLFGLRSNGEEFQIEASISQVESAEGRLFTVILRDVSERVRAEEKLKESEQYLRATFEQAAVGIMHMTVEGRILRVNQRICEITGYSPEELQRLSFQEITVPEDIDTDMELHKQLVDGQIQTFSREKRYLRKDGSLIWVDLSASLVRDLSGNPKYLIKVIEDITQRKEAETELQAKTNEMKAMTQQLWQAAKLATMGELAASIAHELNNPLAILSLRIESLLASISGSSSEWRELEVMEKEVDRMASLVTNLLQFSRSSERQVSSLDIREEVDRTLELIQNHLVHRHVTIDREYAPTLPLVQADRQQLRQLFLNLISNASDAMPGGGTLYIQIQPIKNNNNVLVEFKDTGIGIPSEKIQRVMEPFFTTKPEGKGTGLGLAICRRIVDEHLGKMQISSGGLNQGTTIRIDLPSSSGSRSYLLDE